MRIYKRSFLLLELLIAFALVTSCAFPLLFNSHRLLKEEIKALERIQLERIAEVCFAEVRADLYAQKILWNDLAQPFAQKCIISRPSVFLSLPGFSRRELRQRCSFWTNQDFKTDNNLCTRITVSFSELSSKKEIARFVYWVYLSRDKIFSI